MDAGVTLKRKQNNFNNRNNTAQLQLISSYSHIYGANSRLITTAEQFYAMSIFRFALKT
jgi:hypothetical protein